MNKKKISILVVILIVLITFSSCISKKDTQNEPSLNSETSIETLILQANGEDFVRQGFTSKDGWDLEFDHIYLTLSEISAYQLKEDYNADEGIPISSNPSAKSTKSYTVDLAEGDESANIIKVDELTAPIGFYNALSWNVIKGNTPESKDISLSIIGVGKKNGEEIPFKLDFTSEFSFSAGEYIGDERKGFLEEGKTGELEMTFHFDHIFGDGSLPIDDSMNKAALGFEPLLQFLTDGKIEVTEEYLKNSLDTKEYNKIIDLIASLGHVGEGHTHVEIIN